MLGPGCRWLSTISTAEGVRVARRCEFCLSACVVLEKVLERSLAALARAVASGSGGGALFGGGAVREVRSEG